MTGAQEFSGHGWQVRPKSDGWRGTLTQVDAAQGVVETTATLEGPLSHATIVFSNPHWSRTSAYRIERVEPSAGKTRLVLNNPCVLGKGHLGRVVDARTITTPIVHEYARPLARKGDSGFFTGKLIRTAAGGWARVEKVDCEHEMTIGLDSAQAFGKPSELFHYHDLGPGDCFEVASTFALEQQPSGNYTRSGTVEAQIDAPEGARLF